MTYGDSKASYYESYLMASLNAIPLSVTVNAQSDNLYIGGITTAGLAARVAADMNDRPAKDGMSYQHVLITLGVNDFPAMPAEAAYKADLATILDTIHAKWATTKVYVALPWGRNYDAQADIMAPWITAVIGARAAWAFVGPDERVWMKGADNGATMTVDGIHPSTPAGRIEGAARWQTIIGY